MKKTKAKKRTSNFDKTSDFEYQLSIDDGKLDRYLENYLKRKENKYA